MIPVGITQRLLPPDEFGERRSALDVRWPRLLARCGLAAVPLPPDETLAVAVAEAASVAGLLLSGGEDLARYGGPAPERDAAERALLDWALRTGRPVLGVCRGMQVVVDRFGGVLHPVDGHVAARHEVAVDGRSRMVTCYHRWAARAVPDPCTVTARRGDVVEAVRLTGTRVHGIMWHPEREDPPDEADLAMIRSVLGGAR
ncbi:gamma-glutamyl-gamma-aminobutyrate hydrolase family protein [Krasilnikovia sp. MM14-A1259]|uniref:gamma-glutamyl-gamma-aminobutyrate hydrolase family protein n=1 Tax=Krasilnikovia sp. MM14-A1259 TaxID=3373539 RepID=UPI0037F8C0F3